MDPEPAGAANSAKVSAPKNWWRENEPWQNYGLSIIFIGLCPLLPIFIEWLARRDISEDSLIITVAIYSVTIALASHNRFYFGFLLVTSIVVSSTYGIGADAPLGSRPILSTLVGVKIYSNSEIAAHNDAAFAIVVLLAFLALLAERFSRHVRNHEEFFEFLKRKRD